MPLEGKLEFPFKEMVSLEDGLEEFVYGGKQIVHVVWGDLSLEVEGVFLLAEFLLLLLVEVHPQVDCLQEAHCCPRYTMQVWL